MSKDLAEMCQFMNANVVHSRTALSDLPVFFRLARSQPRRNPSSVVMTMRTPVELMKPMLVKVLFQSVELVSIAPNKVAIAAANPSTAVQSPAVGPQVTPWQAKVNVPLFSPMRISL
jgi:hypothetical protein